MKYCLSLVAVLVHPDNISSLVCSLPPVGLHPAHHDAREARPRCKPLAQRISRLLLCHSLVFLGALSCLHRKTHNKMASAEDDQTVSIFASHRFLPLAASSLRRPHQSFGHSVSL